MLLMKLLREFDPGDLLPNLILGAGHDFHEQLCWLNACRLHEPDPHLRLLNVLAARRLL